jgi:pilus assembly protein CpaB
MKNKKWLIAAVLGLAAGGLHLTYVRGLENETRGGEMIEVLALNAKKNAGQKIEKKDLATRNVPSAYVDSRVIKADQQKEISGLVAAVDLSAGSMIQWSDFASRLDPQADDLAEMVESGKRAITIPVDKALSMGGMLRPGHRVDILGTFSKAGGVVSKDRITVTLLQNVLVIATGSDVSAGDKDSGGGRFTTVTLSVGIE